MKKQFRQSDTLYFFILGKRFGIVKGGLYRREEFEKWLKVLGFFYSKAAERDKMLLRMLVYIKTHTL